MRAAYLTGHGGREVLEVGELPKPEPGPGEVRIQVKAFALNHLDVFVRRGWPSLRLDFPHVGASDGVGVVDAVGAGVDHWKPGDEVVLSAGWFCGHCQACLEGRENQCRRYRMFGEHMDGAAAEYMVAPARNFVAKPEALSWHEAAAVGVTFLTAWHMLVARARLGLGDRVLVHGASAGMSVAGIQIAKLLGAEVIATTSSPGKAEQARALGADVVIDYRAENLKRRLRELAPEGVDVVFEHVGQSTWDTSIKASRVGGTVVTCGATSGPVVETDLRLVFIKQLNVLGSTMGTRAELVEVLRWIAAGKLRPVVDRVLPLSEIVEGHRLLEEADHFGKIILEP